MQVKATSGLDFLIQTRAVKECISDFEDLLLFCARRSGKSLKLRTAGLARRSAYKSRPQNMAGERSADAACPNRSTVRSLNSRSGSLDGLPRLPNCNPPRLDITNRASEQVPHATNCIALAHCRTLQIQQGFMAVLPIQLAPHGRQKLS